MLLWSQVVLCLLLSSRGSREERGRDQGWRWNGCDLSVALADGLASLSCTCSSTEVRGKDTKASGLKVPDTGLKRPHRVGCEELGAGLGEPVAHQLHESAMLWCQDQ